MGNNLTTTNNVGSPMKIDIMLDDICKILSKFLKQNVVRSKHFTDCVGRQECSFYINSVPSNCYNSYPNNTDINQVGNIQMLQYVSPNEIGTVNYFEFYSICHTTIQERINKNDLWIRDNTHMNFAKKCLQKPERFTDCNGLRNIIIELGELMKEYTEIIFTTVGITYIGAGGASTIYSIHNEDYTQYHERILNNSIGNTVCDTKE